MAPAYRPAVIDIESKNVKQAIFKCTEYDNSKTAAL